MFSRFLGERLLLTLWVGSLFSIGYIAVPMAFVTLGDVILAGNYAGQLFSAVNLLGLGCGTILLFTKVLTYGRLVGRLWRFWVMLVMVLLTLVFSCYLQPELAAVKQLIHQGDNSVLEQFDWLHLVSKNLYMLVSLLGLSLIVSTDEPSRETKA